MRIVKNIAAVVLLCVVSAVSYCIGYHNNDTKNYEAACLQADFIRFIIDDFNGETEMANIGAEIENSYEEFFQDLDNSNIWKTSKITSIKDFEEYYWCY
jgi:hypothetical protein